MPASYLSFQVKGLDSVQALLRELPRGVKGVAVRAAAEVLVGDDSKGLSHYPGYKFVSRASAYGKPFFTTKQRRWFFAALAEGKIHPGQNRRTGEIARGWKITGQGTNIRIINRAPGVVWVMGANQARQPKKVGWRMAENVINGMVPSMTRAMVAAANRWIREHIK